MILDYRQLPAVQRLEALAGHFETPCGPQGTMAWRRWGQGPPVVLLHGGSGSWTHWLRNIDALSQEHTLFAADLPGCGESALPPGAGDADTIHEWVAAGIAQCAVGAPVELVAFSFGSLVAGFVAARRPELVKRLHLVGAGGLGLMKRKLDLWPVTDAMPADEREAILRANIGWLMLHDPAAIDATALALHDANLRRDRLKGRRISRTPVMIELQKCWQCPVNAIWGSEDVLIQGEQGLLRGVFSDCDLRELILVPDAGHWVQYERAEAFNAVLAPCLGGK